MKKNKFVLGLFLLTTLVSCGKKPTTLTQLPTFLGKVLDYSEAYQKVSTVQNKMLSGESDTNKRNSKNYAPDPLGDPAVEYFLNYYKDVTIKYEIATASGKDDLNFEVRGEVFLTTIRNNFVNITASMPQINYLFISVAELEELEAENQEWKNSSEALISPFKDKYVYHETANHFGFAIKDFTSAGGGQSTTETLNEFSFHKDDNRLIKWQFQIFNKNELTSGTAEIVKTIEIDFDWHKKV